MSINGVVRKIDNFINNINTKFNEKWGSSESFKSIVNTGSKYNIGNGSNTGGAILDISDYIIQCQNSLNKDNDLYYKYEKVNVELFNLKEKDDFHKNSHVEKKEDIKKLPSWITDSGEKELNTNQKLYFKTEKTRSFKNLLTPLISPLKFINRSLLPIKISFENKSINKELNIFKFNNVSSNDIAFSNFSNKLNRLNKTFTENTNKVISKKINNKEKINIVIKYSTLEKALECKLVNDIKLIKNEFKADLAKNKFQENYAYLPDKILDKLDSVTHLNIDDLFSSNTIDDLKKLLKEKINNQEQSVGSENLIDNVVNAIFNEKNKLAINQDFDGDLGGVKKELSFDLTKELFNNLSKDEKFIGEEASISKIDNLIRRVSKDIYKNMGEPTEKTINILNKSFYENIKQNDNESDLFIRLFKNSSNNINYKWAQDAIILLISYDMFVDRVEEITNFERRNSNDSKGYNSKKNTVIENKLKSIFNRLGLDGNDLEQSKDEVLRKYFANYF